MHIKKQRHYLSTKFHLDKLMVFLVVMYRCETWIIKKAEHQRFDAFELLLEKPFGSPLACKEIQPANPKGNQSWVFIGRTDAVAETSILWLPDAKNWLIGKKTLPLGKIEGMRRRGWQRMRWLDDITILWHEFVHPDNSSSRCRTEKPDLLQSVRSQRESTEWLNWTLLLLLSRFSPVLNCWKCICGESQRPLQVEEPLDRF